MAARGVKKEKPARCGWGYKPRGAPGGNVYALDGLYKHAYSEVGAYAPDGVLCRRCVRRHARSGAGAFWLRFIWNEFIRRGVQIRRAARHAKSIICCQLRFKCVRVSPIPVGGGVCDGGSRKDKPYLGKLGVLWSVEVLPRITFKGSPKEHSGVSWYHSTLLYRIFRHSFNTLKQTKIISGTDFSSNPVSHVILLSSSCSINTNTNCSMLKVRCKI